MGVTSYSVDRATTSRADYKFKSSNEIFSQTRLHDEMSPSGITHREARDSENHPKSLPIIIGLDVTGSMGSVPNHLIKEGLPKMIGRMINNGVEDPAVLFVAVGDHEVDNSPLQVGQFESGDLEMDHWLENTYLEGGGGGNSGESYLLAWYFAAFHTVTDHFEKRGEKGYLITIGDEPNLPYLPVDSVKSIMGTSASVQEDISADELLEAVQEKYEVYHIHISETWRGKQPDSIAGWKKSLGDNLIVCQSHTEVPHMISDIIIGDTDQVTDQDDKSETKIML